MMHKVERLSRRGTPAQRARRTRKNFLRRMAPPEKVVVRPWAWAGPMARQPDEKLVKDFVAEKAKTFKGWGHRKMARLIERLAENFRKAQLAAHIQRCPFTVPVDPKRPNHHPSPCGGKMKRTAFIHDGAVVPALECRTCGRISVPPQLREGVAVSD